MELQEYWQVIQEKVCPRCIDGDGTGECRLPVGTDCALRSFLPQVVATVENIRDEDMDRYIAALRQNVCHSCVHQQEDMMCKKRTDLECALDRYYPMVIQVIEAVRERAANRIIV